jgi:hypothetical protein
MAFGREALMRKAAILAMLLIVLSGGCATQRDPKGFYNPNRTFEQACQDFQECKYEGMKVGSSMSPGANAMGAAKGLREQCMIVKGYRWTRQSELPPGMFMKRIERGYYVACRTTEAGKQPD